MNSTWIYIAVLLFPLFCSSVRAEPSIQRVCGWLSGDTANLNSFGDEVRDFTLTDSLGAKHTFQVEVDLPGQPGNTALQRIRWSKAKNSRICMTLKTQDRAYAGYKEFHAILAQSDLSPPNLANIGILR